MFIYEHFHIGIDVAGLPILRNLDAVLGTLIVGRLLSILAFL